MTILWQGSRRYRGFIDPDYLLFSVVSDLLDDQGSGRTLGERLLLVWNGQQIFCDLELHGPFELLSAADLPAPEALTGGDVRTNFRPVQSIRCAWDAGSKTALLILEHPETLTWRRVGNTGLLLAVGPENYLARICFIGVEEDISGKAESAWLDEIEQLTSAS